jgi:DNA-binding transcriptional MocR family regulator
LSDLKQYTTSARSASELARGLEVAVAAGALAPGERLPSVRRLAGELGLSPATVAAAIAELRRRGVLVTEERRGTRVGAGSFATEPDIAMPLPAGARDLCSGNPDPRLLPDLAAAVAIAGIEQRPYGGPPGMPELLELAREAFRTDGVPAAAACVVGGALDGIERALRAHLRPGDRVAVEDPGYAALFQTLRVQALVPIPVAVDERGMLPEALANALARGARAAIVTPRGQNPTGAALDDERARALRDALDSSPGALVLEDDHLGAIADVPFSSCAGGRARWAAVRSVAKALGPDLRLAILCGDEQTVARVQAVQRCGPGWVSHILQRLVHALWSDPASGELASHARELYGLRRRALLDALRARGVQASGRSGLNVWIPVREEAAVVAALLQRGWAVAPGAPYRLGSSGPAIRVTIAALEPEDSAAFAADLQALVSGDGSWVRSA